MTVDMTNPEPPSHDTDIFVYTCAGQLISKFRSPEGGIVLRIGWTQEENIVLVTSDCIIYLFDMFGTQILKSEFPEQVRDQTLLEIKLWDSGVVLLTKSLEFWLADGFVNHTLLPKSDLIEIPNYVQVLPPKLIRNVEILVAPKTNSLYSYTADEVWDYELQNGPFTRIADSPNGELLAMYTAEGFLWVLSCDFKRNLLEFNIKMKEPPHQMIWCGNDAVVCFWREDQLPRGGSSLLLLVGLNGSHAKFHFDDHVVLKSEIDGVRIVSNTTCEYLYKVHESSALIFGIGSLDPSAMLFDSYTEFIEKKSSSVKSTRTMKDKMPGAIQKCLDAAMFELDPSLQKQLLHSASYGMSFLREFDHSVFNNVCKSIRIINSVRDQNIGIPLTFEQYRILTPQVLVDRLAYRGLHFLALKICEYLNLDVQKLVLHAASLKLSSESSDNQIIESIQKRFRNMKTKISYGQLSSIAYQKGKRSLAIKLLGLEEKYSEQIPLLIQLEENQKALSRAVESGEADLVYFVLITLFKKKGFVDLLKDPSFVTAQNMLVLWLQEKDPEVFRQYMKGIGNLGQLARVSLIESIKPDKYLFEPREKLFQEALTALEGKKQHTFESTILKEQLDLVKFQKEVDSKIPAINGKPVKEFEGLSLSKTIEKLIYSKNEDLALRLKKDFKITDKKFNMIRMNALATSERWEEFEKGALFKGSNVSIISCIEICINFDNNELATKLIEKIPDLVQRAEFYLSMGLVEEAFNVSKSNQRILLMIRNHPNSSPQLKEAIAKLIKI